MQESHPYDTIVVHPGLYKQKVLCEWPLKLVSLGVHTSPLPAGPAVPHIAPVDAAGPSTSRALAGAGAGVEPSGPPALPCALSSGTVTFWQERPPVVLCNCDTVCLSGLTLRVSHASHEYSSVAYGPDGRSVTLDACHVMGHTGLRIPYSLDPLRVLRLNLLRCVIEGAKDGLSGVTALSGQLTMRECCVHDCTYGIEVNRDGHASVHNTDLCFTECALVCEGHVALTHCRAWANTATWQGRATLASCEAHSRQHERCIILVCTGRRRLGVPRVCTSQYARQGSARWIGDNRGRAAGPLVMEDDSERPAMGSAAAAPAGVAASARAGICTGLQADCVAWSEADDSTEGAPQP